MPKVLVIVKSPGHEVQEHALINSILDNHSSLPSRETNFAVVWVVKDPQEAPFWNSAIFLFLTGGKLEEAKLLVKKHGARVVMLTDKPEGGTEDGVTLIPIFRMIAGESIFDLVRRPESS